jgi:hypothetical protein
MHLWPYNEAVDDSRQPDWDDSPQHAHLGTNLIQ